MKKSYGSVFDSIERVKPSREKFPHALIWRFFQFVIVLSIAVVIYIYQRSHDESLTSDVIDFKPNFVLILADDLSFTSLSSPEDETIASLTEELTFLAKNGIYMNNFYGQEVCTPSRASLLTGMYPIHLGVQHGLDNGHTLWGLNRSFPLISQALSGAGYTSYAFGKWHLGFSDPIWLPTARGFSEYIGYVMGENYYWSKIYPSSSISHYVTDFMIANEECFFQYEEADRSNYSTFLYTKEAFRVIAKHAALDVPAPFFLYLPFQNVHSPYNDLLNLSNKTADEYIPSDILARIEGSSAGSKRREYLKSLYLFDRAVSSIREKLEEEGLMDNTYLIFLSDNGGCVTEGGYVSKYRGTKGTLFEGGVKVDSFIYSPLLQNKGLVYENLMHLSDWFPTILSLAGIEQDRKLDGVSHAQNWRNLTSETPRTNLVYNINTNVFKREYNIWSNGSFAVRNEKFKLAHEYYDDVYGGWYENDYTNSDDSIDASTECNQDSSQALLSPFHYWLFDLLEDPYETTNLYDSELPEHVAAKEELYALMYDSMATAAIDYVISGYPDYFRFEKLSISDEYMLPFNFVDNEDTLPKFCKVHL